MEISEQAFDEHLNALVLRVSAAMDGEELSDVTLVAAFVVVASILEACSNDREKCNRAFEYIVNFMRRLMAQGPTPRTRQ